MKYWKLKILGIERDSLYLSNPHLTNNYDECIRTNELFRGFYSHLKERFNKKEIHEIIHGEPVKRKRRAKKLGVLYRAEKIRVKKTKPIQKKLSSIEEKNEFRRLARLCISVTNRLLHYTLNGVTKGEFKFVLPYSKGYIKMMPVKEPGKTLLKRGIDPLSTNFKDYQPVCYLKGSSKKSINRFLRIHVSESYMKNVNEKILKYENFDNNKNVNLYWISKQVHKEHFPNLKLQTIVSIFRRALKYIMYFLRNGINYVTQHSMNIGVEHNHIIFNSGRYYRSKEHVLIKKYRLLHNIRYGKRYNGYYYMALTNNENVLFEKEPVDAYLFLSMEESMLKPNMRPHIYKVKVKKPLQKKYKINRTIDYGEHKPEYIWRWNGKRFKSVNDPKLRLD
jgi:hypothetical protein